MIYRIVCLLALLGMLDRASAQTNVIVLDHPYEKYTVPEGVLATACLNAIGSQSVESFQQENSLFADGIVGPETWAKMSDALKKRGIAVRWEGGAQLAVKIFKSGNQQISLEVSNRTATTILIRARESHDGGQGYGGYIRMQAKFSGKSGDRRFHGMDVIYAKTKMPISLKPYGNLKLPKTYQELGTGATEVSLSPTVATQNGNQILLLHAEPLLLNSNVKFEH